MDLQGAVRFFLYKSDNGRKGQNAGGEGHKKQAASAGCLRWRWRKSVCTAITLLHTADYYVLSASELLPETHRLRMAREHQDDCGTT